LVNVPICLWFQWKQYCQWNGFWIGEMNLSCAKRFITTTNVFFTFIWPCIVTNFFVIKPTRCTNFTNLILSWNSTCFGQFLCPSSGVYSLYTQQWYMSYRYVDSFRSWTCSKAVYKPVWRIPLLSVQLINSWWWTEELSETCTVSCQNKFVILVHLVGFITKKLELPVSQRSSRTERGCGRLLVFLLFFLWGALYVTAISFTSQHTTQDKRWKCKPT
jgi:hypothetical protein